VNPTCSICKRNLIIEAKAAGRYVPFFNLEASQKEANERNAVAEKLAKERSVTFKPFLELFSKPSNKEKQSRLPKTGKVTPLRRTG
jgi:hypothetical protein